MEAMAEDIRDFPADAAGVGADAPDGHNGLVGAPRARRCAVGRDDALQGGGQTRDSWIDCDRTDADAVEVLRHADSGVRPDLSRHGYRFAKRAFDVCATGAALIVLAIPMLVIAAKIKSESPGPVIYAQERVGRGGRPFNVYKFRSMYVDAESRGARWASGDDPRVTPFGRFMRERRIDEVPQFVNILKGDMSLIGPRPERPAFCEEFEKRIHGWHYRTLVRPGLSGLAQVTGGYDLLPKEKIVLDLEYIEHRSALLDLKIILRTLGVVRTGEGAR